MIKEQFNNQDKIIHEFSLPEGFTVYRILVFLKNSLIDFEKEFNDLKPPAYLEDDISKELSLFFQSKAKNKNLLFDFNPRIGVDFGIHVEPFRLGTKPILVIEAKRLSKLHYEYVKGRTGGIERFKREQDGFGKHLNQSVMIGYIQEETPKYWESKINRWINELIQSETKIIWEESDKLKSDNEISNYISNHQRVSGSSIKLYHFWINLN